MVGKICREECGRAVPPYATVSVGSSDTSYRDLCMACCNAIIVERAGVEFSTPEFLPQDLVDADGGKHHFQFNTRHLGDKVALGAVEIRRGEPQGYQFQLIGDDPESDMMAEFKTLLDRMRRALARRHLERESAGLQFTDSDIVRGRITSESSSGESLPLLVIDDKEVEWDHFGRMLLHHEGFQFKLEVFDKSEER